MRNCVVGQCIKWYVFVIRDRSLQIPILLLCLSAINWGNVLEDWSVLHVVQLSCRDPSPMTKYKLFIYLVS